MSTQSKITHSTHVAPTTMSHFLSPLSGSRWRMAFQISSSESISLSLVIFCLAFRAIPTYPCSFDVATTAPHEIDEVNINRLRLDHMGPNQIVFKASGIVDCTLQYGSDSDVANDSGMRVDDHHPLTCEFVAD